MEEEWDAEGFEPTDLTAKVPSQWDDEDADDDVKENWEDDEEEKRDTEKAEGTPGIAPQPPKKNKKNLTKKIEEKERAEQRAMEAKNMTPEEKIAEKLRQQKLQEEADLRAAIETFGITEGGTGIDAMLPSSEEDFTEFGKALVKKIIPFSSSAHYPVFVEELMRDISANMSSNDLKKMKNTIENLHLEKTKIEKGDKAKKNKGKGKAKLRVEGEGAIVNEYAAYDVDEYDDFM